jgi:5-methylcytosine-specific restriction endonuclease McrA
VDITTILKQCEDYLFSVLQLSIRERGLYYHLLRHTRAEGKHSAIFALLPLAKALAVSDSSVREDIRSLNEKGCIRIEDRSRQGHLVHVLLPEEIEGVIPKSSPTPAVDIEQLDFFTGRRFVNALLDREGHRCFYCLKAIRAESCELDHAVSRINGTDHSYRNIVASCHDCNTSKQSLAPSDFLRVLYRKGRLSAAELEERISALEQLQSGHCTPNASLVAAAI